MTHIPYTKDEIKTLNKFYREQAKTAEEYEQKRIISDLVNIGLDCLAPYKRYVQRFAYLMMWRACRLGVAEEYNFGRGKGKFRCAGTYSINDVIITLLMDEEAYKYAKRFIKARAKHKNTDN